MARRTQKKREKSLENLKPKSIYHKRKRRPLREMIKSTNATERTPCVEIEADGNQDADEIVAQRTLQDRAIREPRIYCDGVFDLFHYGHARVFEQIKRRFPSSYLIVGVSNDKDTVENKGPTVMNEHERYESVRHCKHVDEVLEDAPWVINRLFLGKHKIDYVAHDGTPYPYGDIDDIYREVKEAGMFIVTERTEGISTTEILTRILRNYSALISRQLSRGVSRQELNLVSSLPPSSSIPDEAVEGDVRSRRYMLSRLSRSFSSSNIGLFLRRLIRLFRKADDIA